MATRCYTGSPQCVPARFSWLTGLEPSQLGVTKNVSVDLPADAPSIVRWIRNKGWHTEVVGKTHWTSHSKAGDLRDKKNIINELGFNEVLEVAGPRALKNISCELTDEWAMRDVHTAQIADLKKRYGQGRGPMSWEARPTILPNDLYPDVWIAKKGRERLQNLPENQPWLLWISFVGPHEPFDTPSPWNKIRCENLPEATKTYRWIEKLDSSCDMKRQYSIWRNKLDKNAVINLRIDYAQHIKLLDDMLTEIVNTCMSRSDSKRTGIMVTSDHGEMLGDQGMLYKSNFLEPAIRVPFVYQEPGNKSKGIRFKEEIPLTGVFQEVIKGITKDGKMERLTSWANQRHNPVVIEFGKKRAFIQQKKVMRKGKPY